MTLSAAAMGVSGSHAPVILVAEDDRDIREPLVDFLREEGFVVLEAGDRSEVSAQLATHAVDLVTLDLGLGRDCGLKVAREIRAASSVPIVMITGKSDPHDRIDGLESGADDYITKPFQLREVALRIRAILKRYGFERNQKAVSGSTAPLRYAFDASVLDPVKRELRKSDGRIVELTETEFELLAMFLRNPSRILTRDEIWRILRGREWSPLDRTLDGHVARLRRKIEGAGDERMIKSVRNVGYVFAAEVHAV